MTMRAYPAEDAMTLSLSLYFCAASVGLSTVLDAEAINSVEHAGLGFACRALESMANLPQNPSDHEDHG